MLRAVLIALARWLYHMGRDAAILAYIIRSMLPRVLHSFPRIMGGGSGGYVPHTAKPSFWSRLQSTQLCTMHGQRGLALHESTQEWC